MRFERVRKRVNTYNRLLFRNMKLIDRLRSDRSMLKNTKRTIIEGRSYMNNIILKKMIKKMKVFKIFSKRKSRL